MKPIAFTQYLRPDGRKKEVYVDVPHEVWEKAQQILKLGFVFECEVLTTNEVSFTITNPGDEMDVFVELCPNGVEVPEAVHRLIMDFPI